MKKNITTGLYWFRHDLRLTDNPTFNKLCEQVDWLICVYVQGHLKELQGSLCEANTSKLKDAFEQESVLGLDKALRQRKQYLIISDTPSLDTLTDLVNQYKITHIGAELHPGVYEQKSLKALQNACPHVKFINESGYSLFSRNDLPFELEDLPKSFTPFRKQVEGLSIDFPLEILTQLPNAIEPTPKAPQQSISQSNIKGGETAAAEQLNFYLFGTDLIKQYKQTRNALDDWDSSSKLSLWLGNGCLSVRTVYHTIKQYEVQRGANDSTYWLYFELLWREYFQWYLAKHQDTLFHFSGIQHTSPLTEFNQQTFTRWCEGMTEYPIVNACMRQLNQTGYMSNRGRQLVASCFVHELGLDWRYGAAYFEQQLIDYDVASNWGNWQYLAGVGADPRGHRRFNLAKQTATYDPQSVFRNTWLGSEG
ncbi:MAG: deoxyribodipyrimidine photo-lyase [Paraglaciecola sp.]|jgi:deoxyribodipyrimidine photo-lyase